MNRIIFSIGFLLAMVLSSCSSDYRDVIPQGSVALISVNPEMASDQSKTIGDLLRKSFAVQDIKNCGISLSDNVYLFESADGNFGLCAKVSDDGELEDVLRNAESRGLAKSAGERSGCTFYYAGDSWVCGFNSGAMLIMGPVVSSARPQLMQQMAGYLGQDGEEGFTKSRLMKEMESHDCAMAMVVQLNALPEQEELQGLLSLGAPKNADPSQLLISADMEFEKDILKVDGKLTSFNKSTAKSIEDTYSKMGCITDKYAAKLGSDCLLSFLVNSKGKDLLTLLLNDKGMMSSMAGLNAVIDMNKIISTIDGDMMLQCSSVVEDKSTVDLICQVSNTSFMDDVDYWKSSAPAGGVFSKDHTGWYYDNKNDKVSFHFGVLDGQFYCGTDTAKNLITGSTQPSDPSIADVVKGKKVAFVVKLAKAVEGKEGLTSLLPVFGSAKTIVYTVK